MKQGKREVLCATSLVIFSFLVGCTGCPLNEQGCVRVFGWVTGVRSLAAPPALLFVEALPLCILVFPLGGRGIKVKWMKCGGGRVGRSLVSVGAEATTLSFLSIL